MTNKNEKLLVQLSVQELGELITKSLKVEMIELIKVIQMIPKEDEEDKLITRRETANLLRVSVETLHHWNKNKILEAKKMGSRVFYLKSDIMNKLNSVA